MSQARPRRGGPPAAGRRLRQGAEFRLVYSEGVSVGDGQAVVYGRANGRAWSRLGVVAGRRVGNAVARNRLKRVVREAFRLLRDELPAGFDYVVIPRPVGRPAAGRGGVTTAGMQGTLRELCGRLARQWASRRREGM